MKFAGRVIAWSALTVVLAMAYKHLLKADEPLAGAVFVLVVYALASRKAES